MKSIDDVIHRNKLKLLVSAEKNEVKKGNQQLLSLKSDVGLFSRLYIGCQMRDGNLEEFFRNEDRAFPPALSNGSLHLGAQSDLLMCIGDLDETQTETLLANCIIIDGAAVVQILKPTASIFFCRVCL